MKSVTLYDNSRPDALDARGRYYQGLLFLKLPVGFESATFYKCISIDARSDIFGLESTRVVRDCTIELFREEGKFAATPTVVKDVDIRGVGFENVAGTLTFKNVDLSRGYFHNFRGLLNFVECDLRGVRISRTGPLMSISIRFRDKHASAETFIRFEDCDLNGLTLENISIPKYAESLESQEVKGVTFKRCNFIGDHYWKGSSRERSAFVSRLEGSQFIKNNHFEDVFVAQPSLIGVRGFNVLLPDSDLSDVDLRDIDPNVYLHLDRCNLQRANFSGVDLSVISRGIANDQNRPCRSFIGADLRGAVFDGAKFGSVDFSYADLRGASIKGVSFVNRHGVGLEGDVAMFLESKLDSDFFADVSIGEDTPLSSLERSYRGRRTSRRSYTRTQSYSMIFSLSNLNAQLLESLGVPYGKVVSSDMVKFLSSKDSVQVWGKSPHYLDELHNVLSRGDFSAQLRELNYRTASLERTIDLACEIEADTDKRILNLVFLGKGSRVLGLETSPPSERRKFSSFSLPSGFDWSESEIIQCVLDTQLDGVNFTESVLACKFRSLGNLNGSALTEVSEVSNCDFSKSSIYALSFVKYKAMRGCIFRNVVCDRLVIYTMEVLNCVFDQGVYNSIELRTEYVEATSFVDAHIAKLAPTVDYLKFVNCDFSGANIVWDMSSVKRRRDFKYEPLFEGCFYDEHTTFENLSTEQLEGLIYKGS